MARIILKTLIFATKTKKNTKKIDAATKFRCAGGNDKLFIGPKVNKISFVHCPRIPKLTD